MPESRSTFGAPWIELIAIVGTAIVLTAIALVLDLDMALARLVHDPSRAEVRGYTNQLAGYSFVVAAGFLLWLAIPPLRRGYPLVSRCCAVFVMTLIVAVLGFITNFKIERDRPRPKEVVEFGGEYTYKLPFGDEACACKSFPSTAAGFGYLLATPFFVLRRRKRPLATLFLVAGLFWGSYIGYGRMVANLHWITDIIWSAAFVFATASVLARVDVSWSRAE